MPQMESIMLPGFSQWQSNWTLSSATAAGNNLAKGALTKHFEQMFIRCKEDTPPLNQSIQFSLRSFFQYVNWLNCAHFDMS
jgi:hypothetical protein